MLVAASTLEPDPAQREVVIALEGLYQRLTESPGVPSRIQGWINSVLGRDRIPVKGLYIWGSVGRGKTMLMDLFYDCLPLPEESGLGTQQRRYPKPGKLRMHFHRFMQRVHYGLKRHAGSVNPLNRVADDLARQCRVLCFDEFFVSDIGDAMLLGELLRELFSRGVTLVATSNIEPEYLYPDGLQRRRFLPAIDLLLEHTRKLHLDTPEDYRLRVLSQAEIYHSPLGQEAEDSLTRSFRALAPGSWEEDGTLEILARPISYRNLCDDVVWFDFDQVCDGPRSQNDYIELARQFHAVLISAVPCFGIRDEDQARRFISLVDEFYDHNVKLILSAEVPLAELYMGKRLRFEFERTRSRLIEMRSYEYLGREHRG